MEAEPVGDAFASLALVGSRGGAGPRTMTLDEFAELTRRIVRRDGFDGFAPTACFPERAEVRVLDGLPHGVDVEEAARSWALEKADSTEEVLVAFRVGPERFKIIRRAEGCFENKTFDVEATV